MDNFINLYSKMAEAEDPEARRWYIDLSRHIASQVVYLADMLDFVDDDIRKLYPEALYEILSLLPEGMRIEILPDTARRLAAYSDCLDLAKLYDAHIRVFDPSSRANRCLSISPAHQQAL